MICPYCGIRQIKKRSGKTCGDSNCYKKHRAYMEQCRREKAIAEGICYVCRKNPAIDGSNKCKCCSGIVIRGRYKK